MNEVHVALGVAVLALNLVAAVWGGLAWLRETPSVAFWYLLRAAQTAVVLQVLVGGLLVMLGREAADDLHYLYGLLPLPVALMAETLRAGAASQELGDVEFESLPRAHQRDLALAIVRREMGIMAVSCMVIFFLALRAAGTTPTF